ncbi:MAG TPA: ATP-dependent RecD-like DNA helicase, partial [Deltaproteobacteria bacterium]|nr:ATP-dependent RecD-like DNA helicase [Deltaproteobacteria bacterium]
YGLQFRAFAYEHSPPATPDGIRAYLAGEIDEIGDELACRIVGAFGEDTLRVIDETPERLREVPGVGPKRLGAITKAWADRRAHHDTLVFLYSQGLSQGLASKIFTRYGQDTAAILADDPYRLALDIPGIGFTTADRIAMKMGFPKDSPQRLASGILFALETASTRGHTYLPHRILLREASRLLDVGAPLVEEQVGTLASRGLVAVEQDEGCNTHQDAVYLPALLDAERTAAARLASLVRAPKRITGLDPVQAVSWMEKSFRIVLSQRQKEAVSLCASSTCMVLTGGPGTGKTSTITAAIHMFERNGARIALCAPTGRAARRMKEATGRDACTIHRLLEYSPREGEFMKNEHSPLEADLVIVDESSMVDISLLARLLAALTPGTSVILVGDSDQLPSVGPGDCLREIVSSGIVAAVRLDTIYRQDHTGGIVENCQRIKRGLMPVSSGYLSGDYTFIPEDDPDRILEIVLDLVTVDLPGRFGLDPAREIQVMSPMHKGALGVENLNRTLQAALNPHGKPRILRGMEFRVGDKVMQTRNNYDLDVFNGDTGTLVDIDPRDGSCTVAYEDRFVPYSAADAEDLVVAYATTIHKAQGSEYPAVVLPIHTQHALMLARNLLYTAVSRGKRIVVTVGSTRAVRLAVENNRNRSRYTRFGQRLSMAYADE